MNNGVPRHPEAKTMAAFVEGTLPPSELAAVAAHLGGCDECRTVVSETARFEREEAREAERRFKPAWWLLAAAVVAAIAIAIPLIVMIAGRRASPIGKLIAAAPRQHRSVEARLSGFPWARLQAPARGEAKPDPADLKLAGAAGDVLDATADRRDTEAGHAKGVAYLVIGQRGDSIAALERAAHGSNDPRAWNDLAAARFAAATTDEHPSQLPEALADADHALRLDPNLAEARFNRALILEHLGVLDQARKAWQSYLDVDPNSAWSSEARAHLVTLQTRSRAFDRKLFDTLPPEQLVRDFPKETRTWSETLLLADWANADAARAPAILARARAIADALARANGERLLADAVTACERAAGPQRDTLAEAHRLYVRARTEYNKRNAGAAEPQFRRAAELFRTAGSPMAGVATYYAASARFDQSRGAEARDELVRLLASIDRDRHRALAAQIRWELAVVANADGDWGMAIREANAGADGFRALGERTNAAFLDAIAAVAFEMIGERDPAWSRWPAACLELSASAELPRRNAILFNEATALTALDQPAAGAAILELILDQVRGDPAQFTIAVAKRARGLARAGDLDDARRSIDEGRRAAVGVADRAIRETVTAQVDLAAASAEWKVTPGAVIASLDSAISRFTSGGLSIQLPDAYLLRGRAHRRAGNDTAALADYDATLNEIGKQQSTIRDAERRVETLDTAAQALEEVIELQLAHGSIADAFESSDRSRGLFELARAAGSPSRSVPPGVAVIEYSVLAHAVVLFSVSNQGISAESVRVERRELASDVDSFAEKVRRRAPVDEIRRDGAALYRLLIAPVRSRLAGADEIVLVPDRQLYAVPFSALWDEASQRFLVEQYVVRFAPSVRGAAGAGKSDSLAPALVVADPPATPLPRLLASRDEASRIATLHGAVLLAGETATRSRFTELARRAR